MIFILRLPRVFSTSLFLQDKSFSCSEHKFAKSITTQDKLFRANTKTLFLSGLFALVKNGSSWQPPESSIRCRLQMGKARFIAFSPGLAPSFGASGSGSLE